MGTGRSEFWRQEGGGRAIEAVREVRVEGIAGKEVTQEEIFEAAKLTRLRGGIVTRSSHVVMEERDGNFGPIGRKSGAQINEKEHK